MTNSQKVFHPNDNHLRQSSFHMCTSEQRHYFAPKIRNCRFRCCLCLQQQQQQQQHSHMPFILFFSASYFYVWYIFFFPFFSLSLFWSLSLFYSIFYGSFAYIRYPNAVAFIASFSCDGSRIKLQNESSKTVQKHNKQYRHDYHFRYSRNRNSNQTHMNTRARKIPTNTHTQTHWFECHIGQKSNILFEFYFGSVFYLFWWKGMESSGSDIERRKGIRKWNGAKRRWSQIHSLLSLQVFGQFSNVKSRINYTLGIKIWTMQFNMNWVLFSLCQKHH